MEFSKAAVEAKVLFFSERGQILLLHGCNDGIRHSHRHRHSLGVQISVFIIIYSNIIITLIIPSEIDVTPL
jgi:hypothetical protein